MSRRYDIKPDGSGWTIFDIMTGQPVVVMDAPQVGLTIDDARELAQLLDKPATCAD